MVNEAELKQIDRRLAEIEAILSRGVEDRQRVELETERRDLKSRRSAVKAAEPLPVDEAARARDKALLAAELRTKTRQATEWIDHLEETGDYHQARIWRMDMLDLPQRVCRELNVDPALLSEIGQ